MSIWGRIIGGYDELTLINFAYDKIKEMRENI